MAGIWNSVPSAHGTFMTADSDFLDTGGLDLDMLWGFGFGYVGGMWGLNFFCWMFMFPLHHDDAGV